MASWSAARRSPRATSHHDEYKYQREYPQGRQYAHLTGYFSRDYGLGGGRVDPELHPVRQRLPAVHRQPRDRPGGGDEPKGGSVTLTVDPDAQKAAYDGLKALGDDVRGAVVAIEPRTGKILAMVSSPTYDPNKLASHDFTAAGKTKERLQDGDPSPLNNRAIEEVLPPGSTFKLVTAAAALDSGKYTPETMVPGGSTLDLPQTTVDLVNESGGGCGSDQITLTQALQVSCNVSFGAVGLKVGDDALRDMAEKFGWGTRTFTDLDDSLTRQQVSRFPEDPDLPQTALSAIGQFDVAATPLQMAMVGAGIANDGVVMKPYLVDETKSPKLETIDRTDPEPMPDQPAMSSAASRDLREMMVAVVEGGTGKTAQIPGVEVAGKTGTAQSSPDRPPYAWFVSFAPADTPAVAVAVLVQDAGVARDQISGSGLAAPIAKAVMEAVIGK